MRPYLQREKKRVLRPPSYFLKKRTKKCAPILKEEKTIAPPECVKEKNGIKCAPTQKEKKQVCDHLF